MTINGIEEMKLKVDGALPLISAIIDKIGLAERIDNHLEIDQSNRIVPQVKLSKR